MLSIFFTIFLEASAHSHGTPPSHVAPKVEAHLHDVPLKRAHEVNQEVDTFFTYGTKKKISKNILGTKKTVIKNHFISDDGKSSGRDKSTLIEKKDGTTEVERSVDWLHPEEEKMIRTKVKAVRAPNGSTHIESKLKIEGKPEFRGVPAQVKETVTFESKEDAKTGKASSRSTTSYELKAPEHKELNMKMRERIEFQDESQPGSYQEFRRGRSKTYPAKPREVEPN